MKYNKRKKARPGDFNPSQSYIDKAVADYLASGGTITPLEADEDSYETFMGYKEHPAEVDDFLNGGL